MTCDKSIIIIPKSSTDIWTAWGLFLGVAKNQNYPPLRQNSNIVHHNMGDGSVLSVQDLSKNDHRKISQSADLSEKWTKYFVHCVMDNLGITLDLAPPVSSES